MNDLDDALRAMLRERAADISTLPADFADLPGLDVLAGGAEHDERGRSRRLTFVAAAAIVAAIVGTAVGIKQLTERHDARPAAPTPTRVVTPPPTPTPTSVVTPPPTGPAACVTALPPAWASVLKTGSTLGAAGASSMAVSDNGTVLATRDFGTKRDVVLVTPGSAPRSIFTVPDPDQKQVFGGSIEGTWVLVPVFHLPRASNGVIETIRAIVLVDPSTGSTRTIKTVSDADGNRGGETVGGAVLQGGHVYWDDRPTYASQTGTIQDYDIASGKQRTIFTGRISVPQADALGVSWGDGSAASSVAAAKSLPPVVAQATRGARAHATISTDGSGYAWIDSTTRIGWWRPGATAASYLDLPPGARPGQDPSVDVVIAGSFVFLNTQSIDGRHYLVDTRSGAVAPSTAYVLHGGGDVFAGYSEAGPKSATTMLLDTVKLPGLHC